MSVESARLSNGLRIVALPLDGTSFVNISIAVRVGSRYESALQNGMSHFVEHMLFRGSKNYPSSYLLSYALESLGDGLQGETTREYTVYSIGLPPENLHRILETLGDVFSAPLLSDIEVEKQIVFEEMLEDSDCNDFDNDPENISRKLLFGGHTLSQPILGCKSTLSNVTRDDLLLYFKEFYQPDNMVISASGKIEFNNFVEEVQSAFGFLKSSKLEELPIKSFASVNPLEVDMVLGDLPKFYYLNEECGNQVGLLFSFLADGERSTHYIAQMALERILSDGLSSRLQRGLCERRGLLYGISAELDGYTDVAIMDFNFRSSFEKVSQALQEVFRELKHLKEIQIDQQELNKIKVRLRREAMRFYEDPQLVAPRIAQVTLLGLKMPLGLSEWMSAIDGLTAQEIQDVAVRIFNPKRLVCVVEGMVTEVQRKQISEAVAILD